MLRGRAVQRLEKDHLTILVCHCGLQKLKSRLEIVLLSPIKYNQYTSKTYRSLNTSFEIEYASGRIQGELGLEIIYIDQYHIENIEIGLVITEIGQVFELLPFSGIIGISPSKYPTSFLYQLAKQTNVTVISISLSDDLSHLGYISFLNTLPRNINKTLSTDYWEIELVKFFIGDYDICKEFLPCKAVIDTGTSVISLPSYSFIQIQKKYKVKSNCDNANALPNIEIGIGKNTFLIPWHEYIAYDQGSCSLAFMKLDVPQPIGPFFILGGTFLRKVILYLDIINMEIGVLPKPEVFLKNKLINI